MKNMKNLLSTLLLFIFVKSYSQTLLVQTTVHLNSYDMYEEYNYKLKKWISKKDTTENYWNVFLQNSNFGYLISISSQVPEESLHFYLDSFEEGDNRYKFTSVINNGSESIIDFYSDKEFEILEICRNRYFHKELKEYIPKKRYRYKKVRIENSPMFLINLEE